MRGTYPLLALGLVVAAVAAPAAAMTVEEVIAKHVEARGGQRWGEMETMKVIGSYTAFSKTKPFTMERARGNKLRMDYMMGDFPVVTGFDGKLAWSDSGQGPEPLEELDRSVLIRDADFTTALFDVDAMGYEVKLLGEVDFDGMDAIGIELKREDGLVETWYLDPETYLETGRISPGNDWLGPVERITVYDDFREVGGVKIPFYVEAQWYTRNHIMQIETIEMNVDLDEGLFAIPMPPGMAELAALAGTWNVALRTRQQPGADWQDAERSSTIQSHMRGGLLEERFSTDDGMEVVRTFSYDRFNERYRVTQIDSRRSWMNVQEGIFGEDGKLVVSNIESGTPWSGFGMTFHGRVSIYDISDEGFKVDYETSTDGGESWFLNGEAIYARGEE